MLARALCVVVALTAATGLFTEAAPSRHGAARSEDPLIRFHPVSQEQYDRILKLTGVRQPGAFEVRTLQMDFRPLAQLRTSISNDFSTSWHRLLNFAGLETRTELDGDDNAGSSNSGSKDKEAMDGYPLCLVRSSDVQALLDSDQEVGRRYEQLSGVSFGGDLEGPVGEDANSGRPVVNCVVVLKPKKKEAQPAESEYEDGDYEDGVERPPPPPPPAHSWPGYPPQSYPPQSYAPQSYPQPYYPMYGYGSYPAPQPEEGEDSKYKFSIQFGRTTEAPVNVKKEKTAKPQGKSELKATSRQAYGVGLPGSFPGLTAGVPGLPGVPGLSVGVPGIPGSTPIIGGFPGMGFPHGGYGQPPFVGQPGIATPIVIPPQMYGIPGLFPFGGGYGYGGGYSYDHHDDHHDHHDHDDDDHDDHYHYHDHYDDDDHYGHGYGYGYGHGHGGHGGHHHGGGSHHGGGHHGGHYRSLNASKAKKKSA